MIELRHVISNVKSSPGRNTKEVAPCTSRGFDGDAVDAGRTWRHFPFPVRGLDDSLSDWVKCNSKLSKLDTIVNHCDYLHQMDTDWHRASGERNSIRDATR